MPDQDSEDLEKDPYTRATTEFNIKVDELKKLQADHELRQTLERKKKDETTAELVQQILNGQAAAIKDKAALRKWATSRILIPFGTLILGGGGAFGIVRVQTPPEKVDAKVEDLQKVAQESEDLQKKVVLGDKGLESQIKNLEEGRDLSDRRQERIVEILLDAQVQHSASIGFLSEKIDAISSRAKSVKVPEPVTDGQTKSATILENFPPPIDYADPLGDIK